MRLLQFEHQGQQKIGVEVTSNGGIINLSDAGDYEFPSDMRALIDDEELVKRAEEYADTHDASISRRNVRILPPVTNPRKIIGVGLNYKDHCLECAMPMPSEPVIFSKFSSSLIGDGDPIVIPKISDRVDWEAELAVIIGRGGKHIKTTEAMMHVAGYSIANDITAREWYREKNGGQVLLAKSFDTFCPLGPVLLTKAELNDPHNVRIRCRVNDSVVQDSSTKQMIFNINDCISWVSQFCTLEPGDVLLTGTPPGTGAWRNPPVYLKSGDILKTEIEGIGEITNPVTDESSYHV